MRLAVPLLSKACGMDARASLALAQSSLAAAAARGLVREAQRPLSVLNTFGAMLTPRLADGEPDKDMAKGIVVQVRPCEIVSLGGGKPLHLPQRDRAGTCLVRTEL